MSTPASPPMSGVSGSSGIYMGDISVEVRVTPQDNGDVQCDLSCNDKKTRITYRASGETDFDNYPFNT
jgi:hypothetical protein